MFIIGEFINPNMVNNEKNAIDFERYCKDERLSSIEIRSEVYKNNIMKILNIILYVEYFL